VFGVFIDIWSMLSFNHPIHSFSPGRAIIGHWRRETISQLNGALCRSFNSSVATSPAAGTQEAPPEVNAASPEVNEASPGEDEAAPLMGGSKGTVRMTKTPDSTFSPSEPPLLLLLLLLAVIPSSG
jgi:hypothetical protein